MKKYHKEGLKLGRIGYFQEGKGVLMEKSNAYVILYTNGNGYYNIFDTEGSYPIFERLSFYANYTKDGEPYGGKMVCVGGNLTTGQCIVFDRNTMLDEKLPSTVSLEELKEYMYRSDKYFPERSILLEGDTSANKIKYFLKVRGDHKKEKELNEYFLRVKKGIQYKK